MSDLGEDQRTLWFEGGQAPPPPNKGLPRAADVVIALIGLVLVSPILLAAAIAIKLESRGPVLYRQRRVGKDGQVFELFKLRTMRQGADPVGVGTAVTAADPRVTRVGRLLRRFSLDELPNLINVIRGEMRIVGPRATLPAQVELYTQRQRRRLDLRPGVTGWAQIHGRAGIPWEERIELDVWYVEHRSLRLDLKILARTPLALLRGAGVSAADEYAGSSPDSPLRQAAERARKSGGPARNSPAMPEANVETAYRWLEAISNERFDAALALVHPDVLLVPPGGQPPYRGAESMRRWMLPDAFERLVIEPLEASVATDRSILMKHRARARGRASGIGLDVVSWSVWTFDEDGLITRIEIYLTHEEEAARKAAGTSESPDDHRRR